MSAPPPHAASPNARRAHPAVRMIAFLVLLVGMGALASALGSALGLGPRVSGDTLRAVPGLVSGLLMLAAALGATLAAARLLERRGLATVGLGADGAWPRELAIGLGLGAVPPLAYVAILAAAGHLTFGAPGISVGTLLGATLPLVAGLAASSAAEEIVFRGYPLQVLASARGPRFAAVVTGVLFGLAHTGNPGADPLGFAFTALGGVLMGLLVVRTGSLWLVSGYHAGWNVTAAAILGLRTSGFVPEGRLLDPLVTGPDWLAGGAYGFEASVVPGIVEPVLLAAVLLAARLPTRPAALAWLARSPRPRRGEAAAS